MWGRLENENLKDKKKQQKSELISTSEFYFLKYLLERLRIYTNDVTIAESILENTHLKFPSEPYACYSRNLLIALCWPFALPIPNSVTHLDHSLTWFVRLDTKWTLQTCKSTLHGWVSERDKGAHMYGEGWKLDYRWWARCDLYRNWEILMHTWYYIML